MPNLEAEAEAEADNLIRVDAVKAAWTRLLGCKVHSHFMGYLCVLDAAARSGRQSDLEVNFKDFFDRFLRADGLNEQSPYLMPFAGHGKWPTQNRNVAGSYAPSSLRPSAPLLEAATYAGEGRELRISLREGHVDIARRAMLYRAAIPGLAFAIFMYRDYGFTADSATAAGLTRTLQDEFALGEQDFQKLFGAVFDVKDIF